MRLLDELGLLEMLLPEVVALKGLAQPPKWHLYDAFEHSVKAYEVSSPKLRWVALLHDIGKAKCVEQSGNMHGHDIVGEQMAREICERLKFSNADTDYICKVVRWHMVDIDNNMSWNKLRWFAVEHLDVADDICEFKRIDSEASCGEPHESRLKDALKEVRSDGTPLSLKDLKVNGQDLIDLEIQPKDRADMLYGLWKDTVFNLNLNDREKAIAYLEKKSKNKSQGET